MNTSWRHTSGWSRRGLYCTARFGAFSRRWMVEFDSPFYKGGNWKLSQWVFGLGISYHPSPVNDGWYITFTILPFLFVVHRLESQR